MPALSAWQDEVPSPAALPAPPLLAPGDPLPSKVAAALWHGHEIGAPVTSVVASGFDALDKELPGGGWPSQSLTELLQAQPSVLEWRLLAPALRSVTAKQQTVVVVAPPKRPHVPGLQQIGLDERQFIWIDAETPAHRLWSVEQLLKANACGALVAWLDQVRPEQIRRLQVCAQRFEGITFICRPERARHEASAAPLRVHASLGADWQLQVHVLKRRGPIHDGLVDLLSVPGGLSSVLTPRTRRPSRLIPSKHEAVADVVGSPALPVRRRPVASH
jgi:protein ImuA